MAKRKKAEAGPDLFTAAGECHCERCGARCRVAPQRNPDAKMLRHAKVPAGLCINCATHDFLRNTYPPNMILAESGPKILLQAAIREQFAAIMRTAKADARPDEINWNLIVENWDLPWKSPVKPTAANPCNQAELDDIAAGQRPGLRAAAKPRSPDPLGGKMTIDSFEDLNKLEPGLGDDLKKSLERQRTDATAPPPPPSPPPTRPESA